MYRREHRFPALRAGLRAVVSGSPYRLERACSRDAHRVALERRSASPMTIVEHAPSRLRWTHRLASIGAGARVLAAALVAVGGCGCSNPATESASDTGVTTQSDAATDTEPLVADVADTPSADSVADADDGSATKGWRSVSEAAGCPLFEANINEVGFVPLTWAPCGDGCSVSTGGLSKYHAHRGTSGGRALSGDIHLLLDEPVDAGVRVRTIRVSDGKTLAAVELRTTTVQCLPVGSRVVPPPLSLAGDQEARRPSSGRLLAEVLCQERD